MMIEQRSTRVSRFAIIEVNANSSFDDPAGGSRRVHYFERLPDDTVIGLYDGTQPYGEIPESEYWSHHESVAKREHPAARHHLMPRPDGEYPLRAIEAARIRTALISTYRLHAEEYLAVGPKFPETWKSREEKLQSKQRFSPPGTNGYYFGLTVDAAIDEAS